MKKITKKAVSIALVISLLFCSSLVIFANAANTRFTDYSGIEYRGDKYYGVPGESIPFDYICPDEDYAYVCALSLDESVVVCEWDEYGENVIGLEAVDNGVALINIYFYSEDFEEIVDDYYALVVVSDGTDLGEVSYIDCEDVKINYQEETQVGPMIFFDTEAVYYCTFYDFNYDASPFYLDSQGWLYGDARGSEEVTCYVIDAQGNVFSDTFQITVEFSLVQWIIYYLLFGWLWWN